MGTLAGGIAHDFNNILGAILGYGELAQKAAPEGSVVRRYVDNVMHAGGRAKALVERILAFSRSGVGERGPINVQAVIEETLELLAASLPPGVRLEKRLQAGDAAIVGDATQLHQVAMNLCTNALQAMENGGVLEVVLDRADVAQEPQAVARQSPPRRLRAALRERHRQWNSAAGARSDVRPLLHHQGRWRGNRPGSVAGAWHRGGSGRRDRRSHDRWPGHDLHDLVTDCRRSDRSLGGGRMPSCRTAMAKRS